MHEGPPVGLIGPALAAVVLLTGAAWALCRRAMQRWVVDVGDG
jgi:hypothetical protein